MRVHLARTTDYTGGCIIASRENIRCVALATRPRSNVQQLALGYSGSYYVQYPSEFTNEYFQILLENRWGAINE